MRIKTLTYIIAFFIVVVTAIYGIDQKMNPYRGLVTSIEVQSDEETVFILQSELDTWLAGIEASEKAGEQPNLNLFTLAATNAYYLGDLVQAREIYEAYFEYNNINPVAWNNYGNILKKMEDYEKAEGAYMRAIELDADLEEYYRDLIDLYEDVWPEERNDDIKEILEINVSISGQTQWNMVSLAKWHIRNNDCVRAVDYYKIALALAMNATESQDIIDNLNADIDATKTACTEQSNAEE